MKKKLIIAIGIVGALMVAAALVLSAIWWIAPYCAVSNPRHQQSVLRLGVILVTLVIAFVRTYIKFKVKL